MCPCMMAAMEILLRLSKVIHSLQTFSKLGLLQVTKKSFKKHFELE